MRLALACAGVVLLVASTGVWLVSRAYREAPLPRVGTPASQAVDPDASGPIFVEYVAPPLGTPLRDIVAEADAVVTVMLTTTRVERIDLPLSPNHPTPYSVYDFTVRDVVKGDYRAGDSVRIARIGGLGSYEPDFPRPGLGEEFLVFLKRFPEVNGFRHLYGRLAFRVVDGELQPMGSRYREVTGRRVEEVVRELRDRQPHPEK